MRRERWDGKDCTASEEITFVAKFKDVHYKEIPYGSNEYYYENMFRFKPTKKITQYDKDSMRVVEIALLWFDPDHTLHYTNEWKDLRDTIHAQLKRYQREDLEITGSFYTYMTHNLKTKGPYFKPKRIIVLNSERKKLF